MIGRLMITWCKLFNFLQKLKYRHNYKAPIEVFLYSIGTYFFSLIKYRCSDTMIYRRDLYESISWIRSYY